MQDIHNSVISVPYEIIDDNKVLNNNTVNVTDEIAKIDLKIPCIENSEIYVLITNPKKKEENGYQVIAYLGNKQADKIIEDKKKFNYDLNDSNILLPIGYFEKVEQNINLLFYSTGTYTFDDIQVFAVPMDNYEENIKKLQQNELQNVTYNAHEIKGNLDIAQDGILQISTSYTTGWKAYVDGEKIDTLNVNTAFIGVPVKAGSHEIYFKYEVPYLKIGIIATGIGFLLFIVLIYKERYRVKSYNSQLKQ